MRMSRWFVLLVLVGVLFGTCRRGSKALLAADDPGAAATWEEALLEMGRLLYVCSSANAIHGIQLTREQAGELRALAVKVEGAAPDISTDAALPAGLADVREAYRELAEVLRTGGAVSAELEARVVQARDRESAWIRKGLRRYVNEDARAGTCARCHSDPDAPGPHGDGAIPVRSLEVRQEQARAHIVAPLGQKGAALAALYTGQVNDVLTEGQKAVFGDFSCCLLPPKGLSDPVRVGQAALPDWKLDLLRSVRDVPEMLWPVARERVLAKLAWKDRMVRPDFGPAQEAAARGRVSEVFEKARALDDLEFEMELAELAAGLDSVAPPKPPENFVRFQTAFFLTIPGTVRIYDGLMEAMDRAPADAGGATPGAAEAPT